MNVLIVWPTQDELDFLTGEVSCILTSNDGQDVLILPDDSEGLLIEQNIKYFVQPISHKNK